jgi:hypothetical protein
MGNDTKIFIGVIVFSFLLVVGFAFSQGGKEQPVLTEVAGVRINPETYEFGNVPINGGIVTKEYEVKNVTDETIKLKRIATTCMCTQAKVVLGGEETKFFGMEHPGDRNPPLNLELRSGEAAKVVVAFDPAAHGPEGVGPFDRTVLLTFSDPAGIKEIVFNGIVVSE